MKKRFMIPAAIAALMGVGAYFGHATATPSDTSDLLLDNAEALADDPEINLPGVEILCTGGSFGRCHEPNPKYNEMPEFYKPCRPTGYPDDYCNPI